MIYIIICILLISLELAYFVVARRCHIVDKPNLRSSHSHVTLRGGGIIFLFAVWIYALFFGLQYGWFILGLSIIGIVSFIDDIHSLPDSLRLVAQFGAMLLMFYQFDILHLHDWGIVIIALVVCVGITNAFNFMDGINGITAGYSLAVMAPLIFLNTQFDFISPAFLYVISIALLIFCFFNFRRYAKCFAGDVGSISIAFIIIFALGKLILLTEDFSYIIFIAVYGADSILTICHRIMLHENLGEAHRKHAFQLMANELNLSHVTVSLIYMAIQIAISFGMIFCPINHYIFLGGVIIILLVAYLIFMKKYYHLHENYLKEHGN